VTDLRFNSIERLRDWQRRGAFPNIHDNIFNVARSYMDGDGVLDMCCSFGLLGQRILEAGSVQEVVGMDADEWAIEQGRSGGISARLFSIQITPDTLSDVVKIIREYKLSVMVARRCISELFGDDLGFGPVFASAIRDAGIREIFLEGRAIVARPTHPIPSVKEEVALFAGCYREVKRIGQCSYMRAMTSEELQRI
jgi:hypothetical protein